MRNSTVSSSRERFRLVAATIRAFDLRGRSRPRGKYSPSWRRRSSFNWDEWFRSPISSRKSVPSAACSINPFRVRYLWNNAAGVIFPLPFIIHVASILGTDNFDEFHKQAFAIRIGEIGDVPAFQIRPVGMHNGAGVHVVDPEIVFKLRPVPQAAQIINGLSLGLLPGEQTGFFFLSMSGEDAPRGFGQFSDHLPLPRHQFFFNKGKQQ